jgi:hypothetical protein
MYALQSLGMLRHGEAAGLRWRHYLRGLEPLSRLGIATKIRHRRHQDQPGALDAGAHGPRAHPR